MRLFEERRGRANQSLSIDDMLEAFGYGGLQYPIMNQTLVSGGRQIEIQPNFAGYAEGAYKSNGIVFSCIATRMKLFSEVRFKWRRLGSAVVGAQDLFGTPDLELLEHPWPGGTTRDLLKLMELHGSTAGNAYVVRDPRGDRLRVPRPDWMTIVAGSRRDDGEFGDLDTELLGYIYRPQGGGPGIPLMPDQVAHYKPIPDPLFQWRGMSWIAPIIEDIVSDEAMNAHKSAFFKNGATINHIVTLSDAVSPDKFQKWVELFKAGNTGPQNAYKALFLAGGADVKVVGADLRQLDFKVTQAHGETRVANAAQIPPIIVGISEGLDAATYSNYGQARRAFADGTMRSLWGDAAGCLGNIIPAPGGSELWYDDKGVAFLQEDIIDAAEVQQAHAATIKSLIDAGFKPDTVINAVRTGDFSLLQHTGLYSVQLQPPGTNFEPNPAPDAGPAKKSSAKKSASKTSSSSSRRSG